MKAINTGRALLGGIVAGLIIDVIESAMNGYVLKNNWADALKALGRSGDVSGGAIGIYMLGGMITGIIGVWLYSAMAGRLGLGSITAAKAGLVVWACMSAIPTLYQLPSALFPGNLLAMSTITDFFAILLGVTLGSRLYRDEPSSIAESARA